MKIIEVRPSKRFRGHWEAFEAPGVAPTYRDKQNAIDYAKVRFGGGDGEIHVYDEAGKNIVEKIPVDGGSQYGNPH